MFKGFFYCNESFRVWNPDPYILDEPLNTWNHESMKLWINLKISGISTGNRDSTSFRFSVPFDFRVQWNVSKPYLGQKKISSLPEPSENRDIKFLEWNFFMCEIFMQNFHLIFIWSNSTVINSRQRTNIYFMFRDVRSILFSFHSTDKWFRIQ